MNKHNILGDLRLNKQGHQLNSYTNTQYRIYRLPQFAWALSKYNEVTCNADSGWRLANRHTYCTHTHGERNHSFHFWPTSVNMKCVGAGECVDLREWLSSNGNRRCWRWHTWVTIVVAMWSTIEYGENITFAGFNYHIISELLEFNYQFLLFFSDADCVIPHIHIHSFIHNSVVDDVCVCVNCFVMTDKEETNLLIRLNILSALLPFSQCTFALVIDR